MTTPAATTLINWYDVKDSLPEEEVIVFVLLENEAGSLIPETDYIVENEEVFTFFPESIKFWAYVPFLLKAKP